ncbi:MAG TPA: CopD family protein [Methylomirabilota bacterium]
MLIAAWIVRWTGFVALAGLLGGFVLDLFILPAVPETVVSRRRLRALRAGCAVVLLLDTVGELGLRAATMSGGGPGAVAAAVPVVLTHTHFGAVWIGRAAGLLALLALSRASGPGLLELGALAALGVALTVSLTGHASDWGDLSPTAALDWIHVVGATTWTGGLFVLVAVVVRRARQWPVSLLAAVMSRFSRVAGWCLLAVVCSGAYASWVQVGSVDGLWRTVYGRALAVKLLLVLGLVWWGAVNRYTVLPGLAAGGTPGLIERMFRWGRSRLIGASPMTRGALPSRLAVYLTREVMLALLVFACTAVLTESTPARHAHHLDPRAAGDEHAGHAMAGERGGSAPSLSR